MSEEREASVVPEAREASTVLYEASEQVAVITLNRPHRLNAVVPQLVEELCAALSRARKDQVGACVLTGTGRAFCSGHDLKQPAEAISEDEDRRRLQRMQDVTRLIRQAPFPVIAAVHGYALGAGCEFALCCDLVVAASDAVFGFPEVGVGLGVTGGISYLLPLAVGPAKAKELVLLGEHLGAAEAHRLNLVNRLVAPGEDIDCALELARKLAGQSRRALSRAKLALDVGPAIGIEAAFEVEIANGLALHGGADAEHAAAAFRAARPTESDPDK
jgi:enoyl-CoA hydratase/carnithine racemase